MKGIVLVCLSLLFSCSSSRKEQISDILIQSYILIDQNKCAKAIALLNDFAIENSVLLLKAHASAYACRAGYKTDVLIIKDFKFLKNASFLKGVALFSTSYSVKESYDRRHQDLRKAINILLYSGDLLEFESPSLSTRRKQFDEAELQEINVYLIYLLLVQLGRYVYYYGNSSLDGEKGRGPGDNSCFLDYTDNKIQLYLHTESTGSCKGDSDEGHVSLRDDQSKMCHGLVLINNIFHLAPTVSGYFVDQKFNVLLQMQEELADIILKVNSINFNSDLLEILSHHKCMNLDPMELESFFIITFESMFL